MALTLAPSQSRLPVWVTAEIEAATTYASAEKAEATRRAYAADWRIFGSWCAERGLGPLSASPESTAAFLAWEADHGTGPSTLGRRVAAIRYAFRVSGMI